MIQVDGMTIEYGDGKLRINGKVIDISNIKGVKPSKTAEITKDQTIDGDFDGDIKVTGEGVTLIIKGDVDGNVTGTAIEIGGDVDGNVTGNKIDVGGDIDGNVVGNVISRKHQSNK